MRRLALFLIVIHILSHLTTAQAETFLLNNQKGLTPLQNCNHLPAAEWPLRSTRDEIAQELTSAALPPYLPVETKWELKITAGHIRLLSCGPQGEKATYYLYEVYTAADTSPVAEVAVEPAMMTELGRSKSPARGKALALSDVPQIDGPLAFAVCASGKSVQVYDAALTTVLFEATNAEPVLPVQSFGPQDKKKVVGGLPVDFIKVQFPDRAGALNTGWIVKDDVRAPSQCLSSKPEELLAGGSSDIWTFPTVQRPTDSYKTGQRRFSALRSGGRYHAACDLYRSVNEQAVAVSSGQVVRDRYYFYQGTYAIEVKHPGGKIARYGEITGKVAPGVHLNSTVKAGQTVGYVGKVNSNCCNPMLHFELYSGKSSGPLTQGGNKYQRRSDLIDPTALLMQWEKSKFGQSY